MFGKKGQANPFSSGTGLVLALVVMVVVVVLGIVMLSRLMTSFTSGSTEETAANNSISGLSEITNLAPTFGIVIAIVIILALILGLFAFKRR